MMVKVWSKTLTISLLLWEYDGLFSAFPRILLEFTLEVLRELQVCTSLYVICLCLLQKNFILICFGNYVCFLLFCINSCFTIQ